MFENVVYSGIPQVFELLGARRNSLRAFGVLWGYGSREELTTAGAERLFDQPAGLVELASNGGLCPSATTRSDV